MEEAFARNVVKMKEYSCERKPVDWKPLEQSPTDRKAYALAHKELVVCCHDVLVNVNGKGLLIVKRLVDPAKNEMFPIGGRIYRGFPIEESIRKTIKRETNLDMKHIEFLSVARTLSNFDPFGHGKGTDTMNLLYYAEATGELKLDKDHEKPTLITPESYTSELKKSLHPYTKDFLELALKVFKKRSIL